MSVTVTVAPSSTALTTIEQINAELGLSAPEDDVVLTAMIDRASSAIARECRRTFGLQTVTETLAGTGSQMLGLACAPIVAITQILEDGTAITDYSIEDAEAGAIYRAGGWGRTTGLLSWGREAYASGYILPGRATLRYAVTYQAGYVLPNDSGTVTLPGAIEQACLETVKDWFLSADSDPTITSVQIGDFRVGYRNGTGSSANAGSLPDAALGYLRNYRRTT